MSALFLVALFVGLALGSIVMWHGVERYDRRAPASDFYGRELPAQPVVLLIPVAAGALLCFGAAGYQVLRHTALGSLATLGVAVVAGTIGAISAGMLVSRWAVPSALRSPEDPRFSLQGFPGRVLAGIDATDTGEIAYEANGHSVIVRARSLDGTGIPRGTDIAIERLEDGIAYVELWSQVEERL